MDNKEEIRQDLERISEKVAMKKLIERGNEHNVFMVFVDFETAGDSMNTMNLTV